MYVPRKTEERKEEKERMEKVIETFFRENHLVAMETNDPENPRYYRYDGAFGKFKEVGEELIRAKISAINWRINFAVPYPRFTKRATLEVMERAPRIKPDDFFKKVNGVYRVPGEWNDLLVDPVNGVVKAVNKDPENFPSIIALPYDFAKEPPKEMPKELAQVLEIMPPQFRDAFLFELTAPLTFQKQLFVNYIVDYGTYAINTLTTVFGFLYTESPIMVLTEPKWTDPYYVDSFFDGLAIFVYEPHRQKDLETFLKSPALTAKPSYRAPFTYTIRFPVIVFISDYRYMLKPVLLRDAVLIPITDSVLGKPDPNDPTRTIQDIHWDHETRERIILWLAHNVLLRYQKGEYRKYIGLYSEDTLNNWAKNKSPDSGLLYFIDHFIYDNCETHKAYSIKRDMKNAYEIYTQWAYGKYMPASQRQFEELAKRRAINGELCLKKNAVAQLFTT